MNSDAGGLEIILVIVGIVISIMMIIAILKIPQIAKCQKATMLLTAFMAKKEGVDTKLITNTLKDAGVEVTFGSDT